MTVTATAPTTTAPERPARRTTSERTTPQRLRFGTAVAGGLIVALLAIVVVTFTVARDAAATVNSRAATASSASDLYFALSDLDAEAGRLVLLGDGTSANGTDYSSSTLSALTAYNTRNQQADADAQQLSEGTDSPAVSTLAQEITVYRQFAAQGIALDEDSFSPAGRSDPDARGYYGIAATLMQSTILPGAEALRESTSDQLADAAGSAHRDTLIGAIATGLLGLAAVLGLLILHRRMTGWFRRRINLGVLVALLLVAGLAVAATSSLASLSGDSSDAGSSFAQYLAVTRARSGAYDADAAVTRYLLAPGAITGDPLTGGSDTADNPVAKALNAANGPIYKLTTSGSAVSARWRTVAQTDLPSITRAASSGNIGSALALDTGTARGQDAFDFYYFDSALQALSDSQLAAFTSASSSSESSLADWDWLPWALAGAALIAAAAGVRPRLAEFR
jgi:hypothetical protein